MSSALLAAAALPSLAQQPQLRCGEYLLMLDYAAGRMTVEVIDAAGQILRPSGLRDVEMVATDASAIAGRGTRTDWDRFTLDHATNALTRQNDSSERWTNACTAYRP